MRTRSTTRLTREGWYYLFVLAFVLGGALLREINLLLIFGGMLLGALIMNWWMAWRALRRLEIERHVPGGVGAGELAVVGLTLSNGARRATAQIVSVRDSIERAAPGGFEPPVAAEAQFLEVPAGESRRLTYRGRLPRGRYRLGPLRISTRFPLGLLERAIEVDLAEEMIVLPRLGRLTGRGNHLRQETWLGKGRAHHRHGSLEADFYGLRDWRSGDSRRWIHWRTTARRGALMVRQFEQPRQEELVVLVELWQPSVPDLDERDNVELALSFAATVLADACRAGNFRVVLAVAGRDSVVRHGLASRAFLDEAMTSLAIAEASESAALTSVMEQVVPHMRRGGNVLVIGTRPVEMPADGQAALPASRLSVVNVSGKEFSQMFALNPLPAADRGKAANGSQAGAAAVSSAGSLQP